MQQYKKNNDLIYGIRPVMEAINNNKDIDKIILQKGARGDNFKELFQLIRQYNIPFQYVPAERLSRYTRGNHQGVVCFMSSVVYQNIYDVLPLLYEEGKTPFLLLLDKITDVRNMGAIARSAACAGVDAIIVPSKHSSQLNEDAVKTSAGALHAIPVCRHDKLQDVLIYLKECGIELIACTEKGDSLFYQHEYSNPLCILMGSEDEGISEQYLSLCDKQVRIPIAGAIPSLNVSVATGIILFEVLKNRLSSPIV
ncbi:MAG: 23S rRNA (guanosine(2251)-2'-O)-methyltransferase RlmB [Bacteroidales bacterium]|jgi:23S rRNA (guanosine2251-2'-O)-methyltransferase|nr:23S rRNA (guanosine(2251)-2'-O)-methyltransferase RlmB [Bacteroidales bacterium]